MPVATPLDEVLVAQVGGEVMGDGGCVPLIVASRDGGLASAWMVVASQDGDEVRTGWHSGPSAGEVYYERYTRYGRVAHGWVDRETRKLVQAG